MGTTSSENPAVLRVPTTMTPTEGPVGKGRSASDNVGRPAKGIWHVVVVPFSGKRR